MADSEFDLGRYLGKKWGGQVAKVNPDGSALVQLPDGSNQQFDTNAYLRSKGLNTQDVKVQYNRPDQALDENPLGFAEGLNYLMSSDKGRMEGLQNRFGKDNVLPDGEGGALVNDSGVWKKARPGFISNLIANSPEMEGAVAGAGAGASLGATIGSVVPGAGTAVGGAIGGVAGGALGAALAHIVKTEGVEKLNMRSGLDAKEAMSMFGKEAVDNLIWGSVLGVAGAGAKKAFGMFAKDTMAEIGAKLMPGTSAQDWGTVVRSGEDAKAVKANIDEMADYISRSADSVQKGVDPMTKRMTITMGQFMNKAKFLAQENYGNAMNALEDSGATSKANINTLEAVNNLKGSLGKLGVLAKNEEGEFFVHNDPAIAAKNGNILQLFDQGNISTLNKVLKQSESTAGELKFDQVRQLQKGIDSILENTGYYKGGDLAISNGARRTLMAYRQDLAQATTKALNEFNIPVGEAGQTMSAGRFFSEAQGKYSQFREVYDHFALPSKFGGDVSQVRATIDRMLGPKGQALEEAFSKLSQATGQEGTDVLQKLQQLRAGRELSPQYTKTPGVLNTVRETVLGGPRSWANRVSNMTQMRDAWDNQVAARMPVTGPQKTAVESTARFTDWLNNMNPSEKMALVTNPVALRQVWNSVENAPMMHQQAVGQLMQHAAKVVNGPQQGQGQGQ